MILDGHIHVKSLQAAPKPLLERMSRAGVDGGVVISAMPENMEEHASPFEERLEHILRFCRDEPFLFPFLFLNPTGENALEQIDRAVKDGIAGFKIICNRFYPGDPRCMEVYRHIAGYGKPILLHSGILWDGRNPSGAYNRPVEFEPLLQVQGLRFALAHISWPWCDECTAVYGKFCHARSTERDGAAQMFIDNTPGTPEIYRRDALAKLFGAGYDIGENLIFGTDNCAESYDEKWAKRWIETDTRIYEELGLSPKEINRIFSQNLFRFLQGGQKEGKP